MWSEECGSRTHRTQRQGPDGKGSEPLHAQWECDLVSHRRHLSVSNREETESALGLKNNSQ